MFSNVWRRRPVGMHERSRGVEAFQDNGARSEMLGKEFGSEGGNFGYILTFDGGAGSNAHEATIAALNMLLKATNKTGNFDTSRTTIGVNFVENKIAHLLVTKNLLIFTTYKQQFKH